VSHPEFVDALLDPAAYPAPERPERMEMRETHISWLFFTASHVYKVKKPVDFGFLDFSTLEERHTYCQEEVRLNRRISPGVYLGVVEIREVDGRCRVVETDPAGQDEAGPAGEDDAGPVSEDEAGPDTGGELVDYAVKMRRLPEDRWLERLLESGEADQELARRIARRIAGFHADARTTEIGGIDTVRFNTRENFAQTRRYVGSTLDEATYDVVRAYTRGLLDARRELFLHRSEEGRVRDGHGDLHAGQVCVENGIDFIDCIEFNQRFRFGDVAADLAFLAMDLDHWERPDLRRALVDEYVEVSGDEGLWEILGFYQCYRAYTRGKVNSLLLDDPDLDEDRRPEVIDEARSYFELARRYAGLEGPLLVLVTGLMGTGKTSLANALGPRLGATVLSSDPVRKELAGMEAAETVFEEWGAGIYAAEFDRRTYQELHGRARERLERGEMVVLDASYRERSRREAARRVAREAGARFLVVQTVAPDRIVEQRLVTRHRDGGSVSDGRLELYRTQKERFEPVDEVGDARHVVVDTSGPRAETTLSALEAAYRRLLGPANGPEDMV